MPSNRENNYQESVPSIEQMEIFENAPLFPNQKVELILISAGIKPATDIELFSDTWLKGEKPKKFDENKLKEIKKALDASGLISKISNPRIDEIVRIEDDSISVEDIKPEDEIHLEREVIEICVAKSEDTMEELVKAMKDGSDEEMGRLFGFPETAVKEYLKGKDRQVIARKDLPEEIKKQEWSLFATFMLSRENWEKELEEVKKWAETVKANSQKIYYEYVEDAKKMTNFN